MPPGPHALVALHGGPMDRSAMAVKVDGSTGLPPELLRFTVEGGGEEFTYRRESAERDGHGWHATYEGSTIPGPPDDEERPR